MLTRSPKNFLISYTALATLFAYQEAAVADSNNFTYVDASYIEREVDDFPVQPSVGVERNIDFDGFRLRVSKTIGESWLIEGQYLENSGSTKSVEILPASLIAGVPPGGENYISSQDYSVDFTQAQLSVGYRLLKNPLYQLYVAAGLVKLELDVDTKFSSSWLDAEGNTLPGESSSFKSSDSYSENEPMFSLILKSQLSDNFELGLRVDHVDFEGSSATGYTGEVNYMVGKNISLFVDAFLTSDETQYGVGARYYY